MKSNLPEKLRICLVGRHFQILSRASDSGLIWPLARGLAKLGHEVTVLSTRSPLGKYQVERDGVTAFFLQESDPNMGRKDFQEACLAKFSELHSKKAFHLVHSLDSSGYRIGKLKKQFGIAMAYDAEATQMAQIFSILGMSQETVTSLLTTAFAVTYKFLTTYFGRDRKVLLTADGVFVTNAQQRLLLERYYLYPDFHTYTVPYGVELGDLTAKEKPEELRKKLGLPENSHVSLTISDMTELDEVKNILKAFEKVAIKKPNSYLLLVGNGPLFKQIEFEILSLALGRRVILTGAIKTDELSDYLLLSDVFINLSARSNGFEPILIEAMAQQKMIIGSEVSPMSHLVDDGQDGFLIRPADIESLSQLWIEIFSGTLPTREIGLKAQKKVLELFDPQKMVLSLFDAYCRILLNTGLYKKQRV